MFTTHDIVPFLFYGGFMSKRNWGKAVLKYCPKTKKVWQYNRGKIYIHKDMPSYGLKREELPK